MIELTPHPLDALPNTPFYLKTGWLIDGSGTPVQEKTLLAVSNGFIHHVLADGAERVPGLPVLDGSDHTFLPGLVDGHVHLCMSGDPDPGIRSAQIDAGWDDARRFIERHLAAQVRYGIMAVRDGGDRMGWVLRYRQDCLAAADLPVVVKTAGRAWHGPGRYGGLIGRAPEGGVSLGAAVAADDSPVDHVKIVNSGLNSLSEFGKQTAVQFDTAELAEAVRAAAERGLRVMVHANGDAPVRTAIEAGCRSIEHGFFMGRDNLARMADRQITWIPTAGTMKAYADHMPPDDPRRETCLRNLEHQVEQLRAARELGVAVALGTDAGSTGVHHGAGVVEELKLMIAAGYAVAEAVRCAAYNGAQLLDLHGEGMLDAGRPATLIAVPGDPGRFPDSLHRIRLRLNRGRRIAAAT